MIGRMKEMNQLEAMYSSNRFEFMVMYGRRRIGKTTILQEFSKRHKTIYFSAQEKNDALNLQDFSRIIQEYFDGSFIANFANWEDALNYISRKVQDQRTVLIIDEFPFLAETNPSIKSILQHRIDHDWKERNIFLILCGSSVSFMLNDVMGYKSPLYGRSTGSMEVLPFDYLESAEFFPDYSEEDRIIAYGILGGVPRYLNAFDSKCSLRENIISEILTEGAFLNDEPQTLLRMELREPAVYNSILEAVANGCNRVVEIADRIHEEKSKCSKYMLTLQTLRLLEKHVPCGEPESSKKGIYVITDNFYRFWYRYVFSNKSYYEMLGMDKAADEIMGEISNYMGPVFEDICRQYLIRQAKAGNLPFVPYVIDKWWGNNPVIRAQDDVDLLALDKKKEKGIFVECKFRSRPMAMEEYDDLVTATEAFPSVKEKKLIFISRGGFTESAKRRAEEEGADLVGIKELYV
ncbi:MAG: ATP-binding protein [Lachnospiraceae bacterium]|nr:ATP-binding protein [Lachnospiraceae bacterium]